MYVEGGKWAHVGENQGKGIGRILLTLNYFDLVGIEIAVAK